MPVVHDISAATHGAPSRIREADVRRLAGALGRLAVLDQTDRQRREQALSAIAALIGAAAWGWFLRAATGTSTEAPMDSLHHGLAFGPSSSPDDLDKRFSAGGGGLSTLVETHRLAASAFRGDCGRSLILFVRHPSAPPFDDHERALFFLAVKQLPWLHGPRWNPSPRPFRQDLSPRLAAVLDLLLRGRSRKEIAASLEVTPNTINGYVKEIYLHFGVRSHTSLLQRCFDHEPFTPSDG